MNHKDLDAWKQAIAFVEKTYKLTALFPREELYGLTLQIRRASVSIASNISEGAARNSKREFLNFLNYSLGSLAELETQFIIAGRLGYIADNVFSDNIVRLRSLIIGLRNHIRRS